MEAFNLGDRVVVTEYKSKKYDKAPTHIGTVVGPLDNYNMQEIAFDFPIQGKSYWVIHIERVTLLK